MAELPPPRRFSLQEARALLPDVQRRTATARRLYDAVEARLDAARTAPEQVAHQRALDEVVRRWVRDLSALGVHCKGPWLVDFDNGAGFYCWRHPEPTLEWFHSYEDGVAGRLRIN